jgi:hypothetical protein
VLKPPKGLNGGPGYPVPLSSDDRGYPSFAGETVGTERRLVAAFSPRGPDATREMLRRFFLEHQITITEEVIE